MKKILSSTEIERQYIESLLLIEQSDLSGEYKLGNKEVKKVIRLFKILEKNPEIARDVLTKLLEHKSVKVRIFAAGDCLSLKLFEAQAVEVLENISKSNKDIFSFEAKMTLKVWRDQGFLDAYPKK
jgi:hypothetical protein